MCIGLVLKLRLMVWIRICLVEGSSSSQVGVDVSTRSGVRGTKLYGMGKDRKGK